MAKIARGTAFYHMIYSIFTCVLYVIMIPFLQGNLCLSACCSKCNAMKLGKSGSYCKNWHLANIQNNPRAMLCIGILPRPASVPRFIISGGVCFLLSGAYGRLASLRHMLHDIKTGTYQLRLCSLNKKFYRRGRENSEDKKIEKTPYSQWFTLF